jgi:hypothetical protein
MLPRTNVQTEKKENSCIKTKIKIADQLIC